MGFFIYDNRSGNIEINENEPYLLHTREFQALLDPKRNKSKTDKTGEKREKAFKELTYIFLYFSWESPYFDYTEQEKHVEALLDSGLTKAEFEDEVFRAACRKFEQRQNESKDIKLLKAAMSAVDNLIFYLEHVDLNERDPVSGKPIFKSKDLIAEIKGSKDVISGLRELEKQVRKGLETENNLRGDATVGLFD